MNTVTPVIEQSTQTDEHGNTFALSTMETRTGIRYYGTLASSKARWKPCYAFTTPEQRAQWIASVTNASALKVAARKRKQEARRLARESFQTPYNVGDIFSYSWGWEQTNVEWFQLVKVLPRSLVIRPIAQRIDQSDSGHAMAGQSFPLPDQFTGPEIRKPITIYPSGQHLIPMKYGVLSLYTHNRGHYVSWYA